METITTPQRAPFPLTLSRRNQWIILIVLQLIITVAHNSLPILTAEFIMVLTQKLFFIPVILAGFWFGIRGGLWAAVIAAMCYPHYNLFHHHTMQLFTIPVLTDMALLLIVGIITGWLSDLLSRELQRHYDTSVCLDQTLNQLTNSYERAMHSERLAALGEMAASVAHEVRNPLTSMQGAVDILRRSNGTEPQRAARLLDRLQTEIAHLDDLTAHFLEFARPPQATLQLMSPHKAVEISVEALQSQASANDVSLKFSPATQDILIMGDGVQLRQLLINLLLNAIQFAEAGSTITIDSQLHDGSWQLQIKNRGPAIAAELESRIFEPFVTTRSDGTGLGLAVAARIAQAHEGTLTYSHEAGLTCFSLSIPEAPLL